WPGRRLRRRFSFDDSFGPIREYLPLRSDRLKEVTHCRSGRTDPRAAVPRIERRGCSSRCRRRKFSSGLVSELMAIETLLEVHREFFMKLLVLGKCKHRQPPGSRIHLRGSTRIRRNLCFEIEPPPRLGGLPLGIEQPIAADEYLVIGLWQIGYQITALIVGYHDANELRR